ncbi:MAG TPA: hypothetical protein VF469_28995 [Kofleriaceae bacterium]
MKLVIGLALAVGIGCGHPPPAPTTPAAKADPAAAAPGDGKPGGGKIDRSGTVEQQLARLQDAYDRNAEAVEFLNQVYTQQKAQQAERERDEPDPDAVFAVAIDPDLKLGMVEGSPQALVTIVEAWDFG